MLRCPEHVALHEVVVAAELVEIHVGGSDHPNVSVGEPPAQNEGDLLQTPVEPLGPLRLQSHLLLEVLHQHRGDRLKLQDTTVTHCSNMKNMINFPESEVNRCLRTDPFYIFGIV